MALSLMDLQSMRRGLPDSRIQGSPFGNQGETNYFAPKPRNPLPQVDPIKQLLQQQQGETPYPIAPGTRERFGDPTKVISQAPPSVNMRPQAVAPQQSLPMGWSYGYK